jgi:dihydrofolate reductase
VDYILGRKTFEIWENYWPYYSDFWPGINNGTKYVLSKTQKKSDPIAIGWKNSVFVKTGAAIKKLNKSKGPDIQVWGSSKLIQYLLKNDLVDEHLLKIHPLTLGKGKKLFDNGPIPASFKLTEITITTTGVIIACYKRPDSYRDGKVKTGTIGA